VPPWIVIRKPTTEEHLAIARAFVDSLHENLREPLNRVLSEPKWFLRFSPTARGFGLGAAWAAFRTARLKDIFENEMKSLGIPERKPSPRVDIPDHSPVRSNEAAAALSHRRESPRDDDKERALRRLVQLVISDLPISDLRALSLPVGRVFDHLDEVLK
jgi:hypothetical protein